MEDRLHELRELTDTELAEVAGGTGCGCNGDGNALVNVAVGALGDGELDRVQQILIAKRFGQELDRTALHRPNRHRNIGMAADEDNRQAQLCLVQILLKIEPTLSWQPDVENQAPGHIRRGAIEEFLDRGI